MAGARRLEGSEVAETGVVLAFSRVVFWIGAESWCESRWRLREQGFLDDHQIGEGKQGAQLRRVLGQAAIAQLLMAEQVLDDVEGMLDPDPHLRQRPLDRLRQVPQGFWQGFDDAVDRDVPGDIAVDSIFPGGAKANAINSDCLICHSAGMVLDQATLSRAAWQGIVEQMRNDFKAPFPAEDAPAIVDYLADLKSIMSQSASSQPNAQHGAVIVAQGTAAGAPACAQCHAFRAVFGGVSLAVGKVAVGIAAAAALPNLI